MTPNHTILAIDDDEILLEMLKEALADCYDVIGVHSSRAALEVLERKMPLVILMDVSMQELSGFELCKRIKSDLRTSPIPVLFLTGLNEADTLLKSFQAGAVDFMTKPVNILELRTRINLHIEQSREKYHLIQENLALHQKIKQLSEELNDLSRLTDESFEAREGVYSNNGARFERMNNRIQSNQDTLERFNNLLKKQEELILQTKKTMGF